MIKRIISIAVISVFSLTVWSQGSLKEGELQLNAGLGLSSWGIPLYGGIDYCIQKDITLGGELSFRTYNERINGKNYFQSAIGIAGNGNYHFNTLLEIPSEWDVYAGLCLGFFVWSTPNNYPGDNVSGLGLGIQVGGRYFFTKKMGVNLELGGGYRISNGKIGITYRL